MLRLGVMEPIATWKIIVTLTVCLVIVLLCFVGMW